jgi:ubiquinone/menaquinone biosynthesis C-methylase UbiE
MGVYRDQVFPRILNKIMDRKDVRVARARVCAELQGEVVEVGFGTGLNAPHYPTSVSKVLAVEPLRVCMRLAEPRIAQTPVEVEFAGLTGEKLDLPSESFDAVLSTWTMCSIADLDAALAELRRVLKPGGSLHFIEHGHAPDESVAKWQRRFEPTNKRLFAGCHLTRDMPANIAGAGFTIDALESYYFKGEPKPFGFTFEGRAHKS